MTDPRDRDGDIDRLIRHIHEEIAVRRGAAPSGVSTSAPVRLADEIALPRAAGSADPLDVSGPDALARLLALQDEAFVAAAYVTTLGRPADPDRAAAFVDHLRTGRLSKVEVVGHLRYSPEGRARARPLPGLFVPYLVQRARRVPILGWLLSLALGLLRLPSLYASLQRLESHVFRQRREDERRHDRLAESTESALRASAARIADMREQRERERDAMASVVGVIDSIRTCMVWRAEHDRLCHAVEVQHAAIDVLRTAAERLSALDARVGDLAQRLDGAERGKVDREEWEAALSANEAALAKLMQEIGALERGKVDRETWEAALSANEAALANLVHDIGALERGKVDRDALEDSVRNTLHAAWAQRGLDAALAAVEARLAGALHDVAQQRLDLIEVERRVAAALTSSPVAGRATETAVSSPIGVRWDAFYADFEDRFRGSRETITARMAHYLPIIEAANVGTPDAPLLDIGPGRGEWLELLARAGRTARGIEINRLLAEGCRGRGLDVTQGDALAYLEAQPAGSLGAITAIHVVEHLPLATLLALVDESLRVLRPGGVLVLETPNPENIAVGAHYFWYDPTHRAPLPPPLLQFLVEARGFADCSIDRLAEHRGFEVAPPLPSGTPGAPQVERLLDLVRPAPDYAIVARKP